MLITVVDYNVGNISSILNMIKKLGHKAIVSSEVEQIKNADKLILPGVGAFDYGISQLHQLKLFEVIQQKVLDSKTPILGICLGAQLLTRRSEEGNLPGFGFVDAETVKFKIDTLSNLKIPHMGWSNIKVKKESPLFKNLNEESRFYFVHSYHFVFDNLSQVLTNNEHGYEFASSFNKENIYGVQFHPEKSHKFGMKLLTNFIEL